MIINLPKLGPVNFRDDLTPEQFQAELGRLQEKYDFKLPKPEVGIGTLLKRGFMRGMGETGIALGDVLPAIGASALGFEDYAQKQLGEAAASRQELEAKYPTQFKSYTEIGSPYEALQYGAETLGELGPTALTAMIPGAGASALGSRIAARGAMGAALEAGPLSRAGLAAAETTAKKAGEVAGKRAMYGGVYLGSFAQNAPEVFEGIYQETDKMEPGIAALAGGLSSVLDAIVPAKVLGELGGYGKMKVIEKLAKESGAAPKVWKYIAKEAATTAGSEGLTEAAQESINAAAEQIAGSAKGLLDPENIQRYKESFVKGAIGGSAFGTASGVSQGLTARKEFKDTKEAEEALKAQYEAEKKAGTLTPEKQAEYDIALEKARKQREADLTSTFEGLPDFNQRAENLKALQARMDQMRPNSEAYADLQEQIRVAQEEVAADRAAQAEIDAEKAKGSAFAKVPPTPNTGGLYSPAAEQRRMAQQTGLRDFAFGPVTTNVPGDPITVDTLKNLKVSDRSQIGLGLLGADLETVDGRRQLIQTLENPSFTGKIDEAAYDDLISTFDPEEVKAHRAEMKAVEISPTKQKQQEQTRQFAFGVPDVTRPDTTTGGGSTGVDSQSTSTGATTADETTVGGGDVSTDTNVGDVTGREGQQSRTLTDRQQRIEFGKGLGAVQPYPGMLRGRVNLPAQTAAKNGDFAGVVTALENSKNATVAEVARRAKALDTKIEIDDTAGETYEGRSTFEDQMSIDGAKMHLDALNKLRELAPTVEKLPEGAALPYEISGASIPAIQDGKEYPRKLGLRDIVKNNNSMFTSLGLPEGADLRTKEDFKALIDAFERATQQLGEDKLRLTSTASAIKQGVAGQYDATTNTIRVPEYFAKDESVLAHEIVHAQALNAVANPTKEQKPVVERLNKLYKHVKEVVEQRAATDKNFQSPYGVASAQEFIAEGLSNPDFQYLLSRIRYENTTAWDKFVESIAKLLGLKNDNAFTELLTVYSDLTKGSKPQPQPKPKPKAKTDGTTTTQTQQAEAQGQAATTAPRSVLDRPDFSSELPTIQQKLGGLKNKLDQVAKDARAYFGKVVPELALDSIANDLVYQPTAYRNDKMKAFANSPFGPEPMFGTKEEAAFFLGQGGSHAKNAEAWARANLSPEAVAFMDQKIAQYEKEKKRSDSIRRRQEAQTKVRKATKTQVADEAAAAEAEGEYAPTEEEIAEAKSTKTEAGKRKAQMQRLARQLAEQDPYSDLDDIADTDISGFNADADLAALHTQAHPAILQQLADNNLVGALQGLADSGSSDTAKRFAESLSKLVGNVNLVYGAEKSMYDPKTNTVYLRDGATEYEILHESSHATMSHTLDNPSHPVTRQVTNLFNQMKKGTEGTYGATDVQEFAAEAWSNDAFRNQLKQFKPTGEKLTGWERLMNAVRQMLRLPPKHETALDAIDRMLNDIISPPPVERKGETLYAQSLHNPNVVHEMFTKMGDTIRKQPLMNSQNAVGFWKGAEKIGDVGRMLMYKALNLSALGEVSKKYLGNAGERFASTVEEMAGYQEKLLEAMSPLHKRLTEFRQTPEYQAWSTLVHESTIVDVRPYAEAEKLYRGSPEKEAEWKQLNARFKKLTPNGQKLYRDLFATYKALDTEFLKSLERNIEATVGDKSKAASAYQKILLELSTVRIDHYAPLFREGQYWLQYTIGADTKKEAFESEAERDFARKKLEASGATNIDAYSRADQLTTKSVPSGTMLADIMKIMKDNGAGDDAVNDLIQLVVKAMPEASILKSRQKRTGIGGYVDNAAYVFDNVSSNTARQLARMQYGPELQRIVTEMVETANKARGDVNTYGIELVKEFEGRRKFAMNPTMAGWAQFASSSAFYYNLAGNVSSALVNTLQTPLIVFPQLGGEYGFKESYAALKNALKLYTSSGLTKNVTELTGDVSNQKAMTSIENWVNKGKFTQYKGLIDAMKDRGLLVTSTARDALRSENDNSSGYGSTNKLARYTTLVGSFMFHHAERMNREVTAVAAFDLEMAKLKNSKLSDAEKQNRAIEKALAFVEYSHGAGSTLSGPSLGQSDVGKVLMVFKRFAFSMYYMLFDTMRRSLPVKGATGEQLEAIRAARRQLAGVYGMSALFAGAKGMPLYWVAELAYNMFQDDDEDDFDTVMRGFLGDFAFKGPVNYFTNLSIADRVGWTDLLWREQKGSKADASALSQFMETLLGAPYSIADSILRGKDLIAEGQYERGIEAMLPIGIRNILKGGRYAVEGANTLRGDAVGDVNGYNAAMQVLGFAPADLMKQYEENAYMTEKGKAIKAIEKNALKKYYAAMREGDVDGMMEAREKLFELGAKYPDLKISEKTLTQSVKARDRITNEMHHGVQLDRKLAPYLKQAAAESYGD